MKTRNLTIIAVLLFVTGSVFAQGNQGKRGNSNGQGNGQGYGQSYGNFDGQGQTFQANRFLNIPDLTDVQKTQIQDMQTANMKEMLPLRNSLREKQAHRNTISTGNNVNMADVNKTIDEIGAIKTNMAKKRATQRQNVRKILTDDQRVFFDMRSGNNNRRGHGNKSNRRGQGRR